MIIETLSFNLVDDICSAIEKEEVLFRNLPPATAGSLGAILELAHVLPIEYDIHDWLHGSGLARILKAKSNNQKQYQEGKELYLGYAQISDFSADDEAETNFYIRSRRAAEFAGFHKTDATKFVAAIRELFSNCIEHSEAITSAYCAFAGYGNCFEFVVADTGIGVLQSLRLNPEFALIDDSGTALEMALKEGVSRHGGQKDRGLGFRPIFVGLANLSKHLRFRSGDHAHEMRRQEDGSIQATTSQKAKLPGFFCSVKCESAFRLKG